MLDQLLTYAGLLRALSLTRNLKDVIEVLDKSLSVNLNDLAYILSTRRSTLPFRVAYPGLRA